ncbi:MAG: homocysteine S-methyltransferase family protein [Solobacterium sp.]|nr:homocysteine S-methyltransferase family protein [Solobacterium sp.]
MNTLRERLNHEWLFCDGGSGTILQRKGLKGGELPETWNLTHPEDVIDLHASYLKAGCDIFNTNTFGANRLHFPDQLEEIITAAVNLAKQARVLTGREDAFIALDIGPSGKLLEPYGDLSFEDAVELFAEIVRIGAPLGVDLIFIETMSDSYEAKAALLAAKENCDLPVFITTTYDATGKLLNGASPESLIPMLEGLGADALGLNCSLGPEEMIPIVRKIREVTSLPLIVNPNAGLPKTVDGKTVYLVKPDSFSQTMKTISEIGVQVLGGCCGTTPDHIRALKTVITQGPFRPASNPVPLYVSSGNKAVCINEKTKAVGERINPTGKKRFRQALEEGDLDYIISQGLEQEDAGADILDVNVGVPGIDEPAMMKTVVQRLQAVTNLPLQLDSSDPDALEAAMRIYNGRPLINSVSGKQESIERVMPLIKKYGGVLIALCLDENGIPETADGRIAVAQKILEAADRYGVRRSDIILDGLTLTISSDPEAALVTLETIHRAKAELGLHTILGVSNVSFGLPQRPLINSAFLTMAMQNGLSLAIINPNDMTMMSALRSSNALLHHDENCMDYIHAYQNSEIQMTGKTSGAKPEEAAGGDLSSMIERGLISQTKQETERLLKEQMDSLSIINDYLVPALDLVGKGYENGTIFLPQLLLSADAAKAAFSVLKEQMSSTSQQIKGRLILATVKGDIHDIGMNIVKVMLENYGFEVIDLGKDVPAEEIVNTAKKENIRLIGLSALMTTTVVAMEETIALVRKELPDAKVIVGGAVLTEEYAEKIGADAYGKDAMATVRYAESFFAQS